MAENLQGLLDELTPAQRDTVDLVVGAALDDVVVDAETIADFDALPPSAKMAVFFTVGNAADADEAQHEFSDVDDFLAHYGVKGMKWGVRTRRDSNGQTLSKSTANTDLERRAARDKIKGGKGTLEDAHKAALKSTGHRAVNAVTGDKTFWKRTALNAGLTSAGLVAGTFVPGLLSDKFLTELGAFSMIAIGMPPPEMANYAGAAAGSGSITSMTSKGIGEGLITGAAWTGVAAASLTGLATNMGTNLGRAIRGNARVDKSYAALGDNLKKKQTEGTKKTLKTLNRSGSIRKKDLKHDGKIDAEAYLEHFGVKGMKWGVRNGSVGSPRKESKPSLRSDLKIAAGSKSEIERRRNYADPSKNKANVRENKAAEKRESKAEGVNRDAMKAVGKEVAKAAVKYGLPAGAVALGAGIPLAATLGVSVKVLDDPAVKEALAPVGGALKSMTKAVGDIPMPSIPKVSSPFSVKTTRTNSDFNANYVNGEWPMHTNKFGNLVPNPDYVGLKE